MINWHETDKVTDHIKASRRQSPLELSEPCKPRDWLIVITTAHGYYQLNINSSTFIKPKLTGRLFCRLLCTFKLGTNILFRLDAYWGMVLKYFNSKWQNKVKYEIEYGGRSVISIRYDHNYLFANLDIRPKNYNITIKYQQK
jgi:hypothetical protein